MELRTLQTRTHNMVLALRGIELLIKGDLFKELWSKSTHVQRSLFIRCLDAADRIACRNWIRNHEQRSLSQHTMVELKQKAADRKIYNYSRMTREDLICALTEEVTHEK
jgi:hypothetical protein